MVRFIGRIVAMGVGAYVFMRLAERFLPGLGGGPIGPVPVGPIGVPPRPIDPDDR